MTQDSESSIEVEIDELVRRLEPPIRQRHEVTFSTLISALMARADRTGDEAEKDRLITHGLAIQQQWLPLGVRDDLLTAWSQALAAGGIKFGRRYNLFVANEIHYKSRDRWNQLWNQHQLLQSHSRRISEWGEVKNSTVKPLLDRAKLDVPGTGQFAPLKDSDYRSLEMIFQRLEQAVRRYHRALLEGLAMQQEWMDEWGYDEPGVEMDHSDS